MDDWKKTYSNNDTVKVALPYFWEKFDSKNYSIWFCEYKYPEELRLAFMSCNLIGGMLCFFFLIILNKYVIFVFISTLLNLTNMLLNYEQRHNYFIDKYIIIILNKCYYNIK